MIQNVKKILAPIDFSDFSREAMHSAWELASDLNAEMHIVHVVQPRHTLLSQSTELARTSAIIEQTEQELARIKKTDFQDSTRIITAVLSGPPAVELAKYAVEQQIDLIMCATHGRTGAEHLIIGSIAEKLVRLAPCSVLVYRTPRR